MRSKVAFPADNVVELLRQRALEGAEQTAYVFLRDGESEIASLSYAELDRRARAIAAVLQERGGHGERVLLLYPPGLAYIEAFFGSLYAGAVAIPTYPPDPLRLQRTMPRFLAVAGDAQPRLALTTGSVLDAVRLLEKQYPQLAAVEWVATDRIANEAGVAWREPALTTESLALLQYTSGSTAEPKGVMLSHGNLLHNSAQIQLAFETGKESRGVIWLPGYHDMGLIGGILQPLYVGFPVTLMSPLHFLQKPIRWLRAISRTKATHSGGPNFAYDLCVRKVRSEQIAELDLSSWEIAFNGAEPVRDETMQRFAQAFAPCGFRRESFLPCYGLAEVAVFGTAGARVSAPVVQYVGESALAQNRVKRELVPNEAGTVLVSSGHSWLDQTVIIADPKTNTACPEDRVGEIWIAGPSVAKGYWNRPEESAQIFRAFLADSGDGPYLRTGDLGFLEDGELFVTGRLKDLIIIDGLNRYPQDIELTVEKSHPGLRAGCSAAFSIERDGQEELVVVAEVAKRPQLEALAKSSLRVGAEAMVADIRRALANQHDLRARDIVLLSPGTVPKTSSGKIRRHACRQAYLAGTLQRWVGP